MAFSNLYLDRVQVSGGFLHTIEVESSVWVRRGDLLPGRGGPRGPVSPLEGVK